MLKFHMKILLIDDDKHVRDFVCKGFKEHGHAIQAAEDGKEGLILATTEHFDILIVDRMMPELDGLTLIKTIRGAGSTTPVIILSALGKVDDRIEGLRSGSDDYLVKPFSFDELLARAEILTKRLTQHEQQADTHKLTCGDIEIDLLAHQVKRGKKLIDLQSREYRLLEYLVRNQGKVITRTMLLEKVWDYHFEPQTNVIDVHISRMRQKLNDGFDHDPIQTIRGAGYMIKPN